MGERTALNSKQQSPYILEEEYVDYEPYSTKTKVILLVVGSLIGIVTLYIFIFLLPALFIPEATALSEIVKVSELNSVLVPLKRSFYYPIESIDNSGKDNDAKHGKRKVERLLLVGDIHGHYKEFRKLLQKMKFDKKTDHLLVLGDFISKGPDSLKVLDYLIDNNIDCILGNHEYDILNNYANFHRVEFPDFNSTDVEISSGFNSDPDYLLAKKLQPKHVKYINQCSIIKKLWDHPLGTSTDGRPLGVGHGIAVHAGIRWDLPLEEQDPLDNLQMRYYVEPFYNQTASEPNEDTIAWSKIYNSKQKNLDLVDQTRVFYGHDARKGLNINPFTNGIDSGCDVGKKLTGLVLHRQDQLHEIKLEQNVVQVGC